MSVQASQPAAARDIPDASVLPLISNLPRPDRLNFSQLTLYRERQEFLTFKPAIEPTSAYAKCIRPQIAVALAVASLIDLGGSTAAHSKDRGSISGLWTNPAQSVVLSIEPCGETLCGVVKWASQQAKRDAAKGTGQLINSSLLTGLRPNGGTWTGRLFIPDENIEVKARLQLVANDRLKVRGCGLAGLICDSQVWIRSAKSFQS